MRVERVRYALAVVRHGSLRRAAAELGISQPTLSAQLTALEEELNTVLFVRGRHGATATPAALSLAPLLQTLVVAEDRLAEAAMSISEAYEGHVRIGATSLGAERAVAPAIAHVAAQHPGLKFSVVEEIADLVGQRVAEGAFDFGVVTVADPPVGPPPQEGLRWKPLRRLRLGVYAPRRHPLAAESSVSWRQLAGFPLVSVKEGSTLWQVMAAHLDRAEVVAYAGNIRSVQVMAHHGVGLGIAPEPPPDEQGLPGCTWVPLRDGAELEIRLCQRRDAPLSRPAQVVRDVVISPP